MKKVILSCGLLTVFGILSNEASAQTGTLHGTTEQHTNSSGGTTSSCPSSPNICTTNTKNPNGTNTIVIFQYDKNGNLTGTQTIITKMGADPHVEDPAGGYIHSAETTEGVLYGKLEVN